MVCLRSFHPEVHQPPAHALILFHSLQMTMKRPREQCKIKPQWPATVLTDAEKANRIVRDALEKKSGGEEVLEEYQKTKTLKHSTRRQLVNIVVSHMTEIHG